MSQRGAPNVILIIADTMRGDRLSCTGHVRRTTPALDRLAEESMVYGTAVSPATWTPPSHASIFTGTYASRHGVDRTHPYLDTSLTTVPEYLQARGYRTFGISSNYWISTATHYDRGFDVFYQSWQLLQARSNPALERQRRRDPSYVGPIRLPLAERLRATTNRLDESLWRTCSPFMAVDMGAGRVNRVVTRWMKRWAALDEPFFAFIHYMEPHLPYRPPTRFLRQHVQPRDLGRLGAVNQNALKCNSRQVAMDGEQFDLLGRMYDAEVSYTDHCVGELIDGLRASGLLDRTLIVFTSDHGEHLGEHGLMDHMFSVHDSVVRVPLLVRYPGGTPRGLEAGLVQTLDVFPTIATVVGAEPVGRNGGAALAAQFQGGPLPPFGASRTCAISELRDIQPPIATLRRRYPEFDWSVYDRSLWAVRTATHKYVRGSDGSERLFALESDPGETIDRRTEEAAPFTALRAELDAWRGSFTPASHGGDAEELDGEIRQRLQDLGYLGD